MSFATSRDPAAGPHARAPLACRMCGSTSLREAGEVEGFEFVECANCLFTFTPQVTAEGQRAAYESGYHGPEQGAPGEGWAHGAADFLRPAIERLGGGPLRMLDLGAGQSSVPDVLRREGHRVVAVDVAPPLRPHPDRLTGDLLEMGSVRGAPFDLAFAYQVFEHLPEPMPYLERMLELTRVGGLVVVHTDMEMPEREAEGFEGWWYVLPPDHCVFFRHRTFEVALAGTPHRIVGRTRKTVVIERG